MQFATFGRYQIKELIGQGGMGNVYRAFDPRFSRDVALKVLPAGFLQDPQFHERFAREAEIMGSLEHAAIVPVYDTGEDNGQPYIVMRLLAGGTLAERMNHSLLPIIETARIISILCSGLDKAHSRQIVHRDLKPSNILFDEDDNPYIADFGIARLAAATTTVTIIGTPHYMAPEQAEGGALTPQADIYQLGIILYEMLTGEVPFDADTPAALMYQHVFTPAPSLRSLRPELPADLDQVVRKALAKNPADRFASAGSLAQALKHTIVKATPLSPPSEPLAETEEKSPYVEQSGHRTRRPFPWFWLLLSLFIIAFGFSSYLLWIAPLVTSKTVTEQGAEDQIIATAIPAGNEAAVVTVTNTAEETAIPTSVLTAVPAATNSMISLPTSTPLSPSETTIALIKTIPPASETPSLPPPTSTMPAFNIRDNAPLALVPAGNFIMGLTADQATYLVSLCAGKCSADDLVPSQPAREVWLDDYLIYKTEVTNGMYANCVQNGSCGLPVATNSNLRDSYYNHPDFANYPVVYVDWYSAGNYCLWAGGRLPTEAEWEKAARGTQGRIFPWGDNEPTDQLANNNGTFNDTTPVGAFPSGASPYGLLDMTGNVWEWTADWYEADYYRYAPLENPQGPTTSSVNQRTGRGGSWEWNHAVSSVAYHDWWEPYKAGSGVGFRCVIDLPDE